MKGLWRSRELGSEWWEAIVAHEVSNKGVVSSSWERLGARVSGVDGTWHMSNGDMTKGTPLLESKVANFDVSGSFGWTVVIGNVFCRSVVFIKEGTILGKAKVMEHKASVLAEFGTRVACH